MLKHIDRNGNGGDRERPREPLPIGLRLRDTHHDREGVILDVASQYTHPQAQPIFSYLVRWDDGQVQALAEGALRGGHGIEPAE